MSDRPQRSVFYLHGLFGAGRNWRLLATSLHEDRPDWGGVLVDLPLHGRSTGLGPPHTVQAAAHRVRDLLATEDEAESILLGHSFGGKVALAAVRGGGAQVRQVWVVDSAPSASLSGGSAAAMLETLATLPARFRSCDEGVTALVETGLDVQVARWMGTNLIRREDVWVWRFSQAALGELLADFQRADLWQVIEDSSRSCPIHFVKAEDSDVLSESDCARLEGLESDLGVYVHRVPGGHWVNVDSPGDLKDLLARTLPD